MYKIADRLNKHLQLRKQRFATDNSSQQDNEGHPESSQSHSHQNPKDKNKTYSKNNHKLKENMRRMHKFLTETQSSSQFVSSQEDECSSNLKRRGAAIVGEDSDPHKKIKGVEDQVDLNKIVEDSLNFVQKIKSTLPSLKK